MTPWMLQLDTDRRRLLFAGLAFLLALLVGLLVTAMAMLAPDSVLDPSALAALAGPDKWMWAAPDKWMW